MYKVLKSLGGKGFEIRAAGLAELSLKKKKKIKDHLGCVWITYFLSTYFTI